MSAAPVAVVPVDLRVDFGAVLARVEAALDRALGIPSTPLEAPCPTPG